MNHSSIENQIYHVTNFHDLVTTPFQGEINAICWERKLLGDFSEIVKRLKQLKTLLFLRKMSCANLNWVSKEILPVKLF
jgi:hypothetical protein